MTMNDLTSNSNRFFLKAAGSLIVLFLISGPLWAHDNVQELEKLSKSEAAILYLQLGFTHILPLGFDHILFVLSLLFTEPEIKTRSLAGNGIYGSAFHYTRTGDVQGIYALSRYCRTNHCLIHHVRGVGEYLFSHPQKVEDRLIVFMFGLVHGMGFANALGSLGLPQHSYLTSLVMFNVGVELGQLAVIVSAFFAVWQMVWQ